LDPANARRADIEGNLSASQVKGWCTSNDGVYSEWNEGGVGSYSCTTDCRGTGNNNIDVDHCTVTCTTSTGNNCYGWIPEPASRMAPISLQDLVKAPPVAGAAR
jgi:hypothetical protein